VIGSMLLVAFGLSTSRKDMNRMRIDSKFIVAIGNSHLEKVIESLEIRDDTHEHNVGRRMSPSLPLIVEDGNY
jgi:hypothetical protein